MPRFFAALLLLFCTLVALPCWSGSYLNRAALLLNGARTDRAMVAARSNDAELVRVVLAVAKARSAVARSMIVPKAVVAAHPHLLLALENCERAYAAAAEKKRQRFVELLQRARSEDLVFRAVIKRLGYTLPATR